MSATPPSRRQKAQLSLLDENREGDRRTPRSAEPLSTHSRKRKSPKSDLEHSSPMTRLRGLALERPWRSAPLRLSPSPQAPTRFRSNTAEGIFDLDFDELTSDGVQFEQRPSTPFGVPRRRSSDIEDDVSSYMSTPSPPNAGVGRHTSLASGLSMRLPMSLPVTVESPLPLGSPSAQNPQAPPSLPRWFVERDDPLDALLGARNGYRAS